MAEIKTTPLTDFYEVKEELGRGRFAVVKRCIKISTGEVFAAKCIRKARAGRRGREQLIMEIDILTQSNHPKLVKLYDVFETRTEMILILEYAAGGDLHKHCLEQIDSVRTEKEICSLIYQIVEAAIYLHDNHVVHLDLKPENILLKNDERFPEIRLIDFGLSRRVDLPYSQYDIVGTPEYVAPEILAYETIELSADLWSIGVVTYVLLSGISPFAGDDVMETYGNISNVDFDFDAEEFDDISDEAKDFVECLLIKDPKERLKIRECLEHPWLKQMEQGVKEEDIAAAIKAKSTFKSISRQESSSAEEDSGDESVFSSDDEDAVEDQPAAGNHFQSASEEMGAKIAASAPILESENNKIGAVGMQEVNKDIDAGQIIDDAQVDEAPEVNVHAVNESVSEEKGQSSTNDIEDGRMMSEVKSQISLNDQSTNAKGHDSSIVIDDKVEAGLDELNNAMNRDLKLDKEESEIDEKTKSNAGSGAKKPSFNLFDIDSLICGDDQDVEVENHQTNFKAADETQQNGNNDMNSNSNTDSQNFNQESIAETKQILKDNIDMNGSELHDDSDTKKESFEANENRDISDDTPVIMDGESAKESFCNENSNKLEKLDISSIDSFDPEKEEGERANDHEMSHVDGMGSNNVGKPIVFDKDPNESSNVISEENDLNDRRYLKQRSSDARLGQQKHVDEMNNISNSKKDNLIKNEQRTLVKMKSVDENMLAGRKKGAESGKNKLGAHLEKLTKAGLNFNSENDIRKPGPAVLRQGSARQHHSADKIIIDTSPQLPLKDFSSEPHRKTSSQSSRSSGSRTPSSGRVTPDSGRGTPTGVITPVFSPAALGKDVKTTPQANIGKQATPVEDKSVFPKRSAKVNLGVRQGLAAQMASKFGNAEKKESPVTTPSKVCKAASPQSTVSNKNLIEAQSPDNKGSEITASRSPQMSPFVDRKQKFSAAAVAENENKSPKNPPSSKSPKMSPLIDRKQKFNTAVAVENENKSVKSPPSSRSPQMSPLVDRKQKFSAAAVLQNENEVQHENKSPKNPPTLERAPKLTDVKQKANDEQEEPDKIENSEMSKSEKVKKERQARRQKKTSVDGGKKQEVKQTIVKQPEVVDGAVEEASSEGVVIQKFDGQVADESDQEKTAHQVIVQPKGLRINFNLQGSNKFKATEMNVPLQIDRIMEKPPSPNKWDAKLSNNNKPVKFKIGETGQGVVTVPAPNEILDQDHDFGHIEHTAIGAIATMPRTPLREMRGKSRTSRDRGDSSPSSPRKSYRRLYVTHVKGSKSEQEADIAEDMAEFKTKVEKDELKVELLVKFPEIKFGTL